MKLPIAVVDLKEYNDIKNRMNYVEEFLDTLKETVADIHKSKHCHYDLERIEKWIKKIEPQETERI